VLKSVVLDNMTPAEREVTLNEARLMTGIQHKHVVRLYESFIYDNSLYIVMEYADGGDLGQRLDELKRTRGGFDEADLWHYLSQIIQGLSHLHRRRILHRDIKPANIFLDSKKNVKVGDFGLSKLLGPQSCLAHTTVGTPLYFSPELCEGKAYDQSSDIWALGCLLYQLASGNAPFLASNQLALGNKIVNSEPPPLPNRFSPAFVNLVRMMLLKQPEMRPSAVEILENFDMQTISTMQIRHDAQTTRAEKIKMHRTILKLESTLSKTRHDLSSCRRNEATLLQKVGSLVKGAAATGNLRNLLSAKESDIARLKKDKAELASELTNIKMCTALDVESEVTKQVNAELSKIAAQIQSTLLDDLVQCGFGKVNPDSLRCLRFMPAVRTAVCRAQKEPPLDLANTCGGTKDGMSGGHIKFTAAQKHPSFPNAVSPSPSDNAQGIPPALAGESPPKELQEWSEHSLSPSAKKQPEGQRHSPTDKLIFKIQHDDTPRLKKDHGTKGGNAQIKKGSRGPEFVTPSPPTNPLPSSLATPPVDFVDPPAIVRIKWNDSVSDDEAMRRASSTRPPIVVTPTNDVTPPKESHSSKHLPRSKDVSPSLSSVSSGAFSPSRVAPFITDSPTPSLSPSFSNHQGCCLSASSVGGDFEKQVNGGMLDVSNVPTSKDPSSGRVHNGKPKTPPLTPSRLSSSSASASSPFHQRTTPDKYLPSLKSCEAPMPGPDVETDLLSAPSENGKSLSTDSKGKNLKLHRRLQAEGMVNRLYLTAMGTM
jgi:NIMA (never in mitosis gene a)-related kinase